ncbi:branched-chain-amino-acid transaminase bat2 [Microbotryomycetes sp. JL201]|nr:branched-chain-amino-acid transaminase bat2 [Microbotryomycetes sp. JL201]
MAASTSFDVNALSIQQTKTPGQLPPSQSLIFGQQFTDHMLTIKWHAQTGWQAPEIKPYGDLSLSPAATVLHYAPTLFEGMKAYKDQNGMARLFRPDMNMARMLRGVQRMGFPASPTSFSTTVASIAHKLTLCLAQLFEGDDLIHLIKKLVALDEHFIPTDPGCSLYIRPTLIGTRASLGVGPSDEVLLFVIMSPVGKYYPTGAKPVSLLASSRDVRAWPGGCGTYKFGANYAPTVQVQQQAAALGYNQILWLFGPEHEITEVGMMNCFVVKRRPDGKTELITPPLDTGVILPGVTRDSVLQLARAHVDPVHPLTIAGLPQNVEVVERRICMGEVVEAVANNSLVEIFGTGTAAVISSVERIGFQGADVLVPCGESGIGEFARAFLAEIEGRQYGRIESDWSVVVA